MDRCRQSEECVKAHVATMWRHLYFLCSLHCFCVFEVHMVSHPKFTHAVLNVQSCVGLHKPSKAWWLPSVLYTPHTGRLYCNPSEMGFKLRDIHTHSNNIFKKKTVLLADFKSLDFILSLPPYSLSTYVSVYFFYPSISSLSPSSWPLISWSPAEFCRAEACFHQRLCHVLTWRRYK